MTAATNFVQTEVPQPPYKLIADQIAGLTAGMKADGHDQETIRAAIHAFSQAAAGASHIGEAVRARPY
jgi:hypothetical protein